ncbi:MAG: hypothetical protein B7Y28_22055 [Polaromonas sp. 16-63-31]|jgi:hypothetical protein|nr:MAG: hypothetical protein B7Y28_22055 [Polaromonas sp. 16-63-31]
MPELGPTMSETYLTYFNAFQVLGIIAALFFARWVGKGNKRLHQRNQERNRSRLKRHAEA